MLNSPKHTIGTTSGDMMGFPDDLPRLNRSPPVNARPEGVQQSWYAKQQRGELPEVY